MEEISFVVDPDLILIGGLAVPVLVELLTKFGATSRVKQHVATGVVAVVVAVALALDIFVHQTVKVDSMADVISLIGMVLAQLTVVRVSVEGGHKLYDAIETPERSMDVLLFPDRGILGPTEEERLAA